MNPSQIHPYFTLTRMLDYLREEGYAITREKYDNVRVMCHHIVQGETPGWKYQYAIVTELDDGRCHLEYKTHSQLFGMMSGV